MPLLDMTDFNRSARIFWWTVTTAGAVIFGFALKSISHFDNLEILKIGAFVLVVMLTGLRPIRVPGTITSFTPGDIFIFLAALFWGPSAAILIAVPAAYFINNLWLEQLAYHVSVDIPVIVLGEFRYGIMGSRHRKTYEEWLEDHLRHFDLLAITAETTVPYASLRATLSA